MIRGFEEVSKSNKKQKGAIRLPVKSTINSAGIDIFTPVSLDIPPQTKVEFYTDVKAKMRPGEVLMLFPRSSTGIKHDLELANTIPVIDCDFYNNPDNEGNIKIVLWNRRPAFECDGDQEVTMFVQDGVSVKVKIPVMIDTKEDNTVHIKAGDRLVQGIFFQTLPADNGDTDKERVGGIGSTGK
jgi:dUTP pyrophosphatase